MSPVAARRLTSRRPAIGACNDAHTAESFRNAVLLHQKAMELFLAIQADPTAILPTKELAVMN
jgi:hypothetical protein